jgi:hypothetical protein
LFDERAEEIRADAVGPRRSGLVLERQAGGAGGEIAERGGRPEACALVEGAPRIAVEDAVGETRAMREQMADGEDLLGGDELVPPTKTCRFLNSGR